MLQPDGHRPAWKEAAKSESPLSVGELRMRCMAMMRELGSDKFVFTVAGTKSVSVSAKDPSTLDGMSKPELVATLQWLANGVMMKENLVCAVPSSFEQRMKLIEEIRKLLKAAKPSSYSLTAVMDLNGRKQNVSLGNVDADNAETFFGLSITNLKGLKRAIRGY